MRRYTGQANDRVVKQATNKHILATCIIHTALPSMQVSYKLAEPFATQNAI
jgi:hypothetical protein